MSGHGIDLESVTLLTPYEVVLYFLANLLFYSIYLEVDCIILSYVKVVLLFTLFWVFQRVGLMKLT